MTKFKFFKGYIGTLDIMDGQTYATASLNYDTPEGHINVRREIPRGRLGTPERHQDILRRLQMTNDSRDLNDNPLRLFQATTTVTVNPTPWTKVKIFGTRVKLVLIETWKLEPIGVVVVSTLLTLVTIIGIAKILSIW